MVDALYCGRRPFASNRSSSIGGAVGDLAFIGTPRSRRRAQQHTRCWTTILDLWAAGNPWPECHDGAHGRHRHGPALEQRVRAR